MEAGDRACAVKSQWSWRCRISISRDLLKLRAGSVIDAHWRVGQDVPLRLNATLIGWSEFEVVSGNLAVRLTELA